jgi:uncharacterized protein (AIM24 family)
MITHEIVGDDMQAVILTLRAGEEVRAEAGAMTYMTDGIDMDARMEGGNSSPFSAARRDQKRRCLVGRVTF